MAKLLDSGEIKQIIVVTDGRSNIGVSPAEAAKRAYDAGITVSTIGIINLRGSSDEIDIEEVEEIAKAGGGLCEYSHIEDLGRTIKNLTHRTAQRTIEQIVSRQLKQIMGEEIESLEPKSRLKIVDFIDKYGENINLKCIVVLDTSGSMRDKLSIARRSVVELLENLQGRKGSSSIAVIAYPGETDGMCSIICSFTSELSILKQKLELIRSGGGTPTGPAILKACELMYQYYEVSGENIAEQCDALKYYV
ncbi:MAG TPA: VWA domain-containing protein [Candidatus Nitrosocosmicus sp.]|nr:VWA domain-containing protein [Candidatus Nitrosocosmicus sp.]